jgi:hypothetical protein
MGTCNLHSLFIQQIGGPEIKDFVSPKGKSNSTAHSPTPSVEANSAETAMPADLVGDGK